MRAAVIADGVVTNIIEVDRLEVFPGLVAAGAVRIGDLWDGEAFSAPPPQPEPVPTKVSKMQAKLALLGAGLLDDVDAAVAAAGPATAIYWADVSEIHRNHPVVLAVTGGMDISAEQLDELFRQAALIV